MRGTLGGLALLTLAFAGGLIALIAFGRCDDGATSLPCTLMLGMLFVAFIIGSGLTALILGITACRAASRSQRGGWFVVFLWLTMLVAAAPTFILISPSVPLFAPLIGNRFLLLLAGVFLPTALSLLTLVYLRLPAARERDPTAPAPSRE
ncbi:MAG TPA: hypothetical protein VH349_04905 [Ktedonobacterales bacterium]|jgi:hypothetical protein